MGWHAICITFRERAKQAEKVTNNWRLILLILTISAWSTAFASDELQPVDEIVELVNTELLASAYQAGLERPAINVSMPDGRLRLQRCPSSELRALVSASSRLPGRASVEVRCEEAETRWKIYVQGNVAARVDIPVPRWNIPRNQTISQTDLEIKEITLTEPLNGVIDRNELVVGKIATRSLNAGEPIRMSQISFPILVKRGQAVTIRYQVGQLELTASGTAQADGQQGDWIRVKNERSGSQVEGRVSADGSVLVASAN